MRSDRPVFSAPTNLSLQYRPMAPLKPITLISDPLYLQHDTGGDHHPEVAERLRAIRERLARGPLAPYIQNVPPRPAGRQWLTAIHTEEYLLRFEEAALSGRPFLDHPDNQMCFDTYAAAVLSAGAGLTGIDLLEKSRADSVFCCVRPPGHHAEKAVALGFCFLNNSSIAARYWQRQYRRRRILIVDWDAHHGNGIQAAFEEDPDVFYLSIHEHPTWSFPGTGWNEETGAGAGKGATLNIPLPPGTRDDVVLQIIRDKVEPVIARFRPEGLIIAAGFDGHEQDDMSGLAYSTQLYHQLGIHAAAWGRRYCPGKVLTILEGGYHPKSLAAGVESYLSGLASDKEE